MDALSYNGQKQKLIFFHSVSLIGTNIVEDIAYRFVALFKEVFLV